MKQFKSFASIILITAMLASLAGCKVNIDDISVTVEDTSAESSASFDPTEPVEIFESTDGSTPSGSSEAVESSETEETTEETTEPTEAPTPTPSPSPTPVPIGKTKVMDAYKRKFNVEYHGKMTTRYPKVVIDGVDASAFNKEIAKKFKPIAKKNESVVDYKYYIGETYVSILIKLNLEAGFEGDNYYVYNVSRVTGKKLSRKEMLKELGIKESTFKSKVKKGLKKWWKQFLNIDKSDYTMNMYKKSLTNKTINSAEPYVNSKGKKSFLVRQIEVPAQIDHADVCATL